MIYFWRYLQTEGAISVKHAFIKEDQIQAVCGTGYFYHKGLWKNDKEGLNIRRKCKRCVEWIRQ